MLAGLIAAVYAANLGDAFLADDYLYLEQARRGLDVLLRHVTVASEPQMLRPWPALFWWLAIASGGGAGLLHLLSLLLHLGASWQVGDLARRLGADERTAWLMAALFAICPLFGEPVLWASAQFDLWATCFALLALRLASAERIGPSTLAFALALASKESWLLLPAVLLLLPELAPWVRRRRHLLAWSCLLALYLAGRFWLFAGPGGYRDEQGQRFALDFAPGGFLRNALLQVPFRLLLPMKELAERQLDGSALAALALAAALCLALRGFGRPSAAELRLPLLWLAALLPTASVLSVDAHLGGARLVYGPLALALAALAAAWGGWRPARGAAGALLVALWAALAFHHAADWRQAAQDFQHQLAEVKRHEDGLASGSGLLIAASEMTRGVLTWRNVGYTLFTSRLRSDVRFLIGTAADLDDPASLGASVRELAFDGERAVETTACQRALLEAPATAILRWADGASRSPLIAIAGRLHGVRLRGEPPGASAAGRLWWRGPNQVFVGERSRAFRYRRDGTAIVHLPAPPADAITFRVQLDGPSRLEELELLEDQPACAELPAFPAP